MLIKPEVEKFARIKVIGVGGAGSNAISTMMQEQNIQGVEFVAINTDQQHLDSSPAPTKIQIGKALTRGLGSGGNPEVGRQSAEENAEEIHQHLDGTDMVFITAGMGGGTGTGAAPFIAEVAKNLGALTVGVVSKPFDFEGSRRRMNAEEGLAELKEKVDTLIVIPNQRLLEIVPDEQPLLEAFRVGDAVLGQSVQGISDIIVMPGLINRDFADVKSIMADAGSALMGIGQATGEDRAVKAAHEAIESPLLEATISGAKGILFNISGGRDLSLSEVNKAAEIIGAEAAQDANIIFGAMIDEQLKDTVKITVIATGFDQNRQRLRTRTTAHAAESHTNGRLSNPVFDESGEPASEDEEKFETPAFLRRR